MIRPDSHQYEEQAIAFEQVYERVKKLLRGFGQPDTLLRHGDYLVDGDYFGYTEVVVFVGNLALLRPPVVSKLQQIIQDFPGWQIIVTVAVRGHYDDWPSMGLYVRPHEIIDALQREYFPKEFQNLEYEGARRDDTNFPLLAYGLQETRRRE